jgi:hypothetical protein
MAVANTGPAIDVTNGNRAEAPLEYGTGKKIVVVHHPDCHFTQNAFKQISSSFKMALLKSGTFIAPLDSKEDFAKISK